MAAVRTCPTEAASAASFGPGVLLLASTCWLLVIGGSLAMAQTEEFFVAPNGNDHWSGRLAQPSESKDDGPLASIHAARLAVARHPQRGSRPVVVWISGGTYAVHEPVVFGPNDGGTAEAPVTYAAWKDERPILDGGQPITGWQRVTDNPGIPPAAGGRLWFASVETGWNFPSLWCDGKRLPLAVTAEDDWERWPTGRLGSERGDQLLVAPATLDRADPYTCAILNWLPTPYTRWSNGRIPVLAVTPDKGSIAFSPRPLHMPKALKEIPWRLENVASGLTGPGRWFLDHRQGRVYLWPPDTIADPNQAAIVAPRAQTLLRVAGDEGKPVRHLLIRGLAFVHANLSKPGESDPGYGAPGAAVSLTGVENVRLADLTLEDLSGNAITATGHVRDIEIDHCTITRIGGAGIIMGGGLALPVAPCARNLVRENLIHNIGQLYWHSSAVALGMSEGSIVRNNEIHHVPYTGITTGGMRHRTFEGWPRKFPEYEQVWAKFGQGRPTIEGVKFLIPSRNLIEHNLVHHTMTALDDGAAIYCHAGHGNIVRQNIVYAGVRDGSMGLYFDDEELASTMERNIVYRTPDVANPRRGSVVHLHNNARHTVRNNILVGSSQVFTFPSSYGGHRIERNIVVYTAAAAKPPSPAPASVVSDGRRQTDWNAGPSIMNHNLFWSLQDPSDAASILQMWRTTGLNADSVSSDPGFRDAAKGDFRLANDSPAIIDISFEPIDTASVGRTKPDARP